MAHRVAFLIGNQTFRPDSGLPALQGPPNDLAALSRLLSRAAAELHVESLASLYVVPSRDGHHIAFPNWNLSSNAWLLRGL